MRYIKVKWIHPPNEYPVLLYSELDDSRWEVRKVDVFADGRMQYASAAMSIGDTALGFEPVPPLDEIGKDPQFEPTEISKKEFEGVWVDANGRPRAVS